MLTYRLLSSDDKGFIYLYFPDGNEDSPGKIRIYFDGSRELISESSYDIGKRYAHHAMKKIDISQKTGTIAWY